MHETTEEYINQHLAKYFSVRDVPVFCWLPRELLTMEIAWLRTVLGRRRISDGRWEYYNE